MTIRVAVVGAAGRMGSTVCQAVEEAEGLELVARLDVGVEITPEHLNGADVAVDFTVPDVTEANVHALIDAGVNVVVGTTGWTEESYARVREHLAEPDAAGRSVLIAPNFALSAVLAKGIAEARDRAGLPAMPDATASDPGGARGAVVDGVHVHAVRLRGLTAHEEVVLGNPGEQLTIRTDSFDRASFMPGVVLAVREVGGHPGLTVGLDRLLGI